MAHPDKPLLVKRYASRRLYNTETSDYVTLEDIAGFIRAGRDVEIIDLKSGENLTRQYLLQIIAEHESKGESVLPVNVLTDLVRSYTTEVNSIVPQFLASSFEMLREQQAKMMENLAHLPNPMAAMPGYEAMKRQQDMFFKAMTAPWSVSRGEETASPSATPSHAPPHAPGPPPGDELAEIKAQLATLQARLARL
jgi:polyhydroxyalkanoate synthesis repressor PhaR